MLFPVISIIIYGQIIDDVGDSKPATFGKQIPEITFPINWSEGEF